MPPETSSPFPLAATARPIAAVIAVVCHQGRTLLVRRANPPDACYWGFPGGKIGAGEIIEARRSASFRRRQGSVPRRSAHSRQSTPSNMTNSGNCIGISC